MKIIPHNPVYMIIMLLMPWRWGKTYIRIENDVIIFGRYYCFDGKSLIKNVSMLNINEVIRIGFPADLNIKMQEKMCGGFYGNYRSQEIDFETKTNIIALNARPYTRKQFRLLMHIISELNPNIIYGNRLLKVLN